MNICQFLEATLFTSLGYLKKKKKDSGYEKDLNKNFKKMKILIITDIKNK